MIINELKSKNTLKNTKKPLQLLMPLGTEVYLSSYNIKVNGFDRYTVTIKGTIIDPKWPDDGLAITFRINANNNIFKLNSELRNATVAMINYRAYKYHGHEVRVFDDLYTDQN